MSNAHLLKGWETYPENLDLHGSNAYGYEYHAYYKQLATDSGRLFVSGSQIQVKVIELGGKDRIFDSMKCLGDYFEIPNTCPVTSLIPQEFSWGKLLISEEAIRKLLTIYAVFPAFIDVIRTFGEKTRFEDDSYATFRFQDNHKSDSFETTYIAKHAEEHGRQGPEDSWSMRQMGVYHKFQAGTGNTFIILNPSRSFQRRLKQIKDLHEPPTSWDIHMMLLSSAMEKWRWYIGDLEKRYEVKKTKAQLSGLEESQSGAVNADIRFEESQDIQVLQDKMLQSSHSLTVNRYILQEIRPKQHQFLGTVQGQETPGEFFAQSLISETSMSLKRLETVLKRVEATLALVRGILDFSCLQSLKSNSKIMTDLTKLTQDENAILVQLSKKASRDTDTIKFLTLLTLVYVPASLVASMMGMGYIHIQKNNQIAFHVAGEFWVFISLTLIFLCATLGSYYVWVKRNSQSRSAERLGEYELSRLSW